MTQILIVEDSKLFGSILKNEIEAELPIKVHWAKDYAEAEKLLALTNVHYFLGLLDLNLPDAPNGEIVDLILSKNIPAIVFTGDLNNEARESFWAKNVVDYILKEGTQSIDYIVSLTHRIYKNKNIKVLVVDDTKFYRSIISQLLTVHQYIVLEAADGVEALKVIRKNPGIELVLTDYNMPNMNGFELTKQLRGKHRRDDMAIIGLSDQVDPILSAQFIKYGANDFINKPFLNEEFYCRVTQAIEGLEHVNRIKELSNKDFLTGLYNRRFFFEVGGNLFASSKRKQIKLAVALLDIDYFKKINDTYGHDTGDEVLRHLSGMLKNRFRDSDIVARIGGEEFCILLVNSDHLFTFDIFENLRKSIEETEVSINGQNLKFTASFGVCTRLADSLETMLKQADILLYQAKEEGRNRVKIDG